MCAREYGQCTQFLLSIPLMNEISNFTHPCLLFCSVLMKTCFVCFSFCLFFVCFFFVLFVLCFVCLFLCRYLHGQDMFDILSNPVTKTLTFERFARLGFIIGVPEEFLQTKLQEYNVNTFNCFDFESFLLYYFDVFSALDNYRRKNNTTHRGDAGVTDKGKNCIIS